MNQQFIVYSLSHIFRNFAGKIHALIVTGTVYEMGIPAKATENSSHGLNNAVGEGCVSLLKSKVYCKPGIVPALISSNNTCVSKMKLKIISEIENKQYRAENKSS